MTGVEGLSPSAKKTPWGEMLRAAAGFGVTPEAFWRLSLREWRLMGERSVEQPLGRDALEALTRRWPDE